MTSLNTTLGLIIGGFGLALIIFKGAMRSIGGGTAQASADYKNVGNRFFFKTFFKREPPIIHTGVDPKYSPSDKGLTILGIILILIGLYVFLQPHFYNILK
tara:strand:- start:865 stop:1167 length:303 start_codon:yes stop_codon:yes gene_type:complete